MSHIAMHTPPHTSLALRGTRQQLRLLLLSFIFLFLLHPFPSHAQSADPDDPSTWTIDATVLSLTPNLTLLLAPSPLNLTVLYLVLPLPSSSTLFPLDPYNPLYVPLSPSPPPTTAAAFLSLFSSATNASDPSFLNTTAITGGSISPSPFPLLLSLPLPPSTACSLYYLLLSPSPSPLTSLPLTSPNTTALSLPPQCLPPPTLTFCPQLPPALTVPSSLNPYALDALAASLYAADLALYSPALSCSAQQPNVSLCNDCLAIRQRWRCAEAFGGCEGEGVAGGGPCQWLCEEKNARCGEVEDCSVYPSVDCNGVAGNAWGGSGWVWAAVAVGIGAGWWLG